MAPQGLELFFVGNGEAFTQFDKVAPRDRYLVGCFDRFAFSALVGRDEVGRVGQGGVAAHTIEVLYPPLCGQAVVIPAHGVEDLFAKHALEAGNDVCVGVGKHVTYVQGSGDGGRGSVDGENVGAAVFAVEGVGPRSRPGLVPFGFQTVNGYPLRQGGHAGGGDRARATAIHSRRLSQPGALLCNFAPIFLFAGGYLLPVVLIAVPLMPLQVAAA